MKHATRLISAMAVFAALAACAQVGGGSLVPATPDGRTPMTLRAIPITSPDPNDPAPDETPAPSPSPKPGHHRH